MARTKTSEAKIKFTADTSEFNEGLKKANAKIKELNNTLKLTDTEMKNNGESIDSLKKKHDLLQDKLSQTQEKENLVNQKLQKAIEIFGENSDAAQGYRTEILKLKNDEEKLKGEIEGCNKSIEEYTTAMKASQTASALLTQKIENQEKELGELKKEYTDVVLEQGKNSKEAKSLANEMKSLNDDLKDSKQQLSDVSSQADKFSDALEDTGKSAEEAANGGFTIFKGIIADLAANAIRDGINALKDMALSTVDTGMTFTSSMSNVKALSGATAEEMQDLTNKAEEMGKKTSFTAAQSADALGYMALAGWDTQEMLDGIGGVLDLAAASSMDLATASDIVTDAMTAFGMSADETGRFVDVLAATSSNSNTTVEMLGQSFKYVGAICGAMGYSVEDAGVALGMMANSGIKAEQAGTSLRSLLTRLSTNAGASANSLGALDILTGQLGVEFFDTSGNARDLSDVLEETRTAWAGLNVEEQVNYAKKMAGQEAMTGFLALMSDGVISIDSVSTAINSMGYDLDAMGTSVADLQTVYKSYGDDTAMVTALMDQYSMTQEDAEQTTQLLAASLAEQTTSWDDLSQAVNNSTGAASDMSATMLDNLKGDVTLMESAFDGLKLSIFDDVESPLRDVVQGITNDVIPATENMIDDIKDGIAWAKENKTTLEGVALAIGSLTVGIEAYNIVAGIKNLMDKKGQTSLIGLAASQAKVNLAFLASPITWVVGGITLLVGGFIYLWNTSEDFRNFWIGLWDDITGFFGDAKEKISAGVDEITGFFTGIPDKIDAGIQNFKETVVGGFTDAAENVKNEAENIKNEFLSLPEKASAGMEEFKSSVKDGFTECFNSVDEITNGKLSDIVNDVQWNLSSMQTVYEDNGKGIKGIVSAGMWELYATYKTKLVPLKEVTETKLGEILDLSSEKLGNIKAAYEENGGGIQGIVSAGFQTMNEISTAGYDVMNVLTDGKLDELKNLSYEKFEGLKEQTAEKLEEMGNEAHEKIETFKKETVENFEELKTSAHEKVEKMKNDAVQEFEKMKSGGIEKLEGLKQSGLQKLDALKNFTDEKLTVMGEITNQKLGNIKSAYEENGGGIQGIVSAGFQTIHEISTAEFDIINGLTGGKLQEMRDSWHEKFNSIHEMFSNGLENIKKLFDFEWHFPELKMPHFKISGSFSLKPPSVPSIDIDWYADGGIMTQPTLFGLNGDKAMVGGEAGPEAILPISILEDYISNSMQKFIASIPQIDYERLGAEVALALRQNPGNITLNLNRREVARAMNGE